jgi:hypothetical protein
MDNISQWRILYRSSDPDAIRKLITSLAAMEFDVRCTNGSGSPVYSHDEEYGSPPFVVEVAAADWPELIELHEEIIREQDEFDAWLDSREHERRRRRRVLILLTIVIAALAVLGLIEL